MTPTLAYPDEAFLESDAARSLRILAEYLEPLDAFARERIHDKIVFFGSARLRADGPLVPRSEYGPTSRYLRGTSLLALTGTISGPNRESFRPEQGSSEN